ncbi:EpsG family protein [Parapedobacter flavus]|uniref:EpsG family protein n=1 Tax=Parapedobacter flavus TaxID=3110225 RepID=UPI003F50E47A
MNDSRVPDILRNDRLNIFHYLALLLICIVVGFRNNVGTDWANYVMWFNSIEKNPAISFEDQKSEIGYFWLSKLVAFLGGNYNILFFFVAGISWTFLFKSFHIRVIPFILYFLFTDEYFFSSMNIVRQFLALSIFVYSVKFIANRNVLSYVLCISLAACFHYSASILILLYFVPFGKLYHRTVWLLLFILSTLLSNIPGLINHLLAIFVKISSIVPVLEHYIGYLLKDKFDASRSNVNLGYLFRVCVSVYIIFKSKAVIAKYPKTKPYFILFFLGAIIYNLFYMYPLVTRFNHYLTIMRPVTLGLVIYNELPTRKGILIALGIIVLYLFLYSVMISQGVSNSAPYHFDF